MTIDDINESTSELTITPRSRKKNPKDPAISRKPGRPIGSKKRRPSKNDTLIFESSVDITNTGILDSDSNAFCMSVPDELPIGDHEISVNVNQEKVSDLSIGSHIEPLLHEETSNASHCIKCPTDDEKPKRRRTKASKPFKSAMDKALNEASRYKLVKTYTAPDSSRYVYKLYKTDGKVYEVSFERDHVLCTCEQFKFITLQKWDNAQEVCKHVALITLHCDDELSQTYYGQRYLSQRTYSKVCDMLNTFNASKTVKDKKKHARYHLLPVPRPITLKNFPYFKKKDSAVALLSKEHNSGWFAEVYNRESSQGKYPICKSCRKTLKIGNLSLRNDYTFVWQNHMYREGEYTLKIQAYRVCANPECAKKANIDISNNALRVESNIRRIEILRTDWINHESILLLSQLFQNEADFSIDHL